MGKKAMKAPMKGMKAVKVAMKTATKSMKGMKAAMKAMKVMKKRAASKIARGKNRKGLVFRGLKQKTSGGLTKESLIKNKHGRIVNKAASARAKKTMSPAFKAFGEATKKARKELGITGFCPVGGKTAQGKALYAKVKSILGK